MERKNLFAPAPIPKASVPQDTVQYLKEPDYTASQCTTVDHILAFLLGGAGGFAVMYVFYRIMILSVLAGVLSGSVYVVVAQQMAKEKRLKKLRTQFFDMLEAMSVAMRAGNPVLKALQSARKDLALIYSEDSDIIVELDLLVRKFDNAVPLSKGFEDFAKRSGLEDIVSFASIYATIEGKSSRADEIVRETQQIISDKMTIEMEIETLMTAAKSEVYIMLAMPLVVLAVIGWVGAGFMDVIYTEPVGRLVATGGLIMFIISFALAMKFSNVEI